MALTECDGPPGWPWERTLQGRLHRITVRSQLLVDNPLGDPARRPLYVYEPPGGARELPAVYLLQAFTGQLDKWLNRTAFEPTLPERLDAMFAAGDCPPALVVMIDAWTSRGGSQFLNSPATGRYLDYLCDEVVPFVDGRFATAAGAGHRGLLGHSSGGYGAAVVAMLRPDVFGGFSTIAGDALFEVCHLPQFPAAARLLRDRFDGSIARMDEWIAAQPTFDFGAVAPAFELYAYACAYSPDPARPGEALLPFDPDTARLIPEVWERWLSWDPVRMVAGHREALASMRAIHLSAGRRDEYFLDLAATALGAELRAHGIEHRLELFEGGHGGVAHRYPPAIAALVRALS